jgi:hypothetical protein
MGPDVRIPEKHKRAGVCYAVTNDGVELPVVDVTHPAFALNVSEEELVALREKFYSMMERRSGTPMFLRRLLFRLFMGRSILMRGFVKASSRFLGGMDTYLLKLGPDNLGAGYAGRGDRRIAASYPLLSVRLRMQDMANLLSTGLKPLLAARPGAPLHLLNVGGGPAVDSFNALILIRSADASLLEARKIYVHVLDLERDAPDFGQRALAALKTPGSALSGIDVAFDYVPYNWTEASSLRSFLSSLGSDPKIVAVSSEGALFEYGSDDEISSNLDVIRSASPPDSFIVGSVTREDPERRRWQMPICIPVRPRGLTKFGSLIKPTGWTIEKAVERPFNDAVRLVRS